MASYISPISSKCLISFRLKFLHSSITFSLLIKILSPWNHANKNTNFWLHMLYFWLKISLKIRGKNKFRLSIPVLICLRSYWWEIKKISSKSVSFIRENTFCRQLMTTAKLFLKYLYTNLVLYIFIIDVIFQFNCLQWPNYISFHYRLDGTAFCVKRICIHNITFSKSKGSPKNYDCWIFMVWLYVLPVWAFGIE